VPKVIVVDSGHGGWDVGSTACDGMHEAVFNWKLSKELVEYLLANYACECHYTHEGDWTALSKTGNAGEELHRRADTGNMFNADLFVSIHHDAAGDSKARGGSLYIWTKKRVYNGEVTSDHPEYEGELAWLPAVGNHNAPKSYKLAVAVEPHVKGLLASFGIPWRGLMCADFQVLHDFNGACMLLETFMGTSPADVAAARKPEFIPAMAKALGDGIAEALSLSKKVFRDPNAVTVKVNGNVVECNAKLEGNATRSDVKPILESLGYTLDKWDGDTMTEEFTNKKG
jgi:N-acetylmuramoyl-L-alanine amidase